MRAKIRIEKVEGGYRMIARLPDGTIEYPQEGLTHQKKGDVYKDARAMYKHPCWQWRENNHTIKID